MKTQGSHAHEDRLLDFAYGELPPTEAQLVEQHVHGCSRCSEALDGIRGVRTSMSRLPLESAPDAGLESLLAYAQQSARRAAAGPEPAPRWWRRLLAPALSVAALSVFGVVVVQVNREVDLSPSLAQHKEAPREKTRGRAEQAMAEASAAPAAPEPAPAPTTAPVAADVGKAHAQMDEEMRDAMPLKPMPTKKAPSKKGVRSVLGEDWSNAGAGSAGGFPDKKVALYGDDEASALDGLSTKESKRKRDVMMPSASTAQRAEPAPEALAAEAEPSAGYASPAESQVAQYAPPEPKQTIRGSASRAAPVASKDSADEETYESSRPPGAPRWPVPRRPHRLRLLSQYQPPAGSAGPVAQAAGVEAQKNEVAPKSAERAAARRSPSIPELMNQAEVANRSGDWAQEVSFLRAALGAGVQGSQRLEVLSRLCDAEFALGRQQLAIEVCKRVMAEAPGSREARMAQRRLERELPSPADEADSDSKAAYPAKK